ncbi:uncharacterized protein LOC135223084 [Macrobrachium nipponense]|uniref:uncharacterized protein LOC135223084 n=1 Tax=Macrobrachium nipponense TaxID=159736 RepID=UPI0030C7F379
MSTLESITAIGEKLGYEGKQLAEFVKEHMQIEKENRQIEREARVARRQELAEKKEKLQLEIKLEQVKKGESSGDGDSAGHFTVWTQKLIPKFSETDVRKAQEAYATLSFDDSIDYEVVKSAVLSAYQLVPEAYRQKFRNYVKGANQTFFDYARHKSVLFDNWLRSRSITDFVDLRELLLLEDFKNSMSRDVRVHLEELDHKTLEEAARSADRFVLTHGKTYQPRTYKYSYSHYQPSRKYVTRDQTQNNSPKVSKDKKEITCYKCGKLGHFQFECKQTKGKVTLISRCQVSKDEYVSKMSKVDFENSKSDETNEVLKNFGEYLHEGRIRVLKNPDVVSKTLVMLRDTGASQSCVLRKSLPENYESKEDNFVLLGGFPNSSVSCPLVEFKIESELVQGTHRFAIIEQLPIPGIDVIIGNDVICPVQQRGERVSKEVVEVTSKPIAPVTRAQSKLTTVDEDEDLNLADLEKEVVVGNIPVQESLKCIGDRKDLVKAQKEDKGLSNIFENAVPENEVSDVSKPCFFIRNEVLYRLSRSKLANASNAYVDYQIVVPEKYRNVIMQQAHDNLCGGHFGIAKTMYKVRKHFFCPSLKKDVNRYCKCCHTCQVVGKPNQIIPKAPIVPITVLTEPFSQIVIDIVGPLPKTSSGNEYILTIMDRTTRYPEAIPIRKISSKVVIKHLTDYFSRFGFPKELQSDRGSNFMSKLFSKKMLEWNIKHVVSSPYHPESQGMLERFHLTMKNALTKYGSEFQSQWDVDLPYVLFAIRSSPNESLGLPLLN